MKAMLFAAGRGERLRPLTDTAPKCMLRFAGKPLLEHWIDKLRAFGVREVVLNVHYLAEVVENYFGSGADWGVRIHYSREPRLLGTAGALRPVQSIFEGERFIAMYADSHGTCALQDIVEFHIRSRSLATMAACWIADPRSCGIVGFDEHGRIERFLEKPSPEQIFSHYINAGIYVFEPEIFDHIPAAPVSDFSRDVFPRMLAARAPLYAYHYKGYALKFDTPEDWKNSEAIVAGDQSAAGAWPA